MDNNIIQSQHTVTTTHSNANANANPHGATSTISSTTTTHPTNANSGSNSIAGSIGNQHMGKNKKRSWIAAALSVMQTPNKKSKGKDGTISNARYYKTTDKDILLTNATSRHSMSSDGPTYEKCVSNHEDREETWRREFEALSTTVQITIQRLEELRKQTHDSNQILQKKMSEEMVQERIQNALHKQEERLTQAYNRELQTTSLRIQNKFMLESEQTKQLLMQSNIRVQELQNKYDVMSQKYVSASDISQMIRTQIHYYLNRHVGGVGVFDTKVQDAVSSMIPTVESRVLERLLDHPQETNVMSNKENLHSQSRALQLRQSYTHSQHGTQIQVTPNPKIGQGHVENTLMEQDVANKEKSNTRRANDPKLCSDQVSDHSSSSISSNDSTSVLKENEKVIIVDRLPGQIQSDEGNLNHSQSKEMNGKKTTNGLSKLVKHAAVKQTVRNKSKSFPRPSMDDLRQDQVGSNENEEQKNNLVDVMNSKNTESRENSVPKRRSSRLAKSSQNPIAHTTPATSVTLVTSTQKSVTVPLPVAQRKRTVSKRAGQNSGKMDKNEDDYHTPVTLGRKHISAPKTLRASRKKKRTKQSFHGLGVTTYSMTNMTMDIGNDHNLQNNDHCRDSSTGTSTLLDNQRDTGKSTLKSPPLMNNPYATVKNGLSQKKKKSIEKAIPSQEESTLFSGEGRPSTNLSEFDENRFRPRRKLIDPRLGGKNKDFDVFDFEE